MYNEWVLASETKYSVKAKKEVTFKITRKVSQYCTVAELKKLLVTKVFSYMKHLGRNRHQTKASDHIINNLKPNEMAIAVDWSMNYCGKYGKETQSVHFGAHTSRSPFTPVGFTPVVANQNHSVPFPKIRDTTNRQSLLIWCQFYANIFPSSRK